MRFNSKAFQQYVLNVKGEENILQNEEEKRDDRIKIIQKVDLTTKGHSERRYDKKKIPFRDEEEKRMKREKKKRDKKNHKREGTTRISKHFVREI